MNIFDVIREKMASAGLDNYKDIVLLIVLFVVMIEVIKIIKKYNNILKLHNSVKQSRSGIDVYLNQRFDLIPNLVECVKAYSDHEKDVIENIVKMRADYNSGKKYIKNAEKISNDMNKLLVLAEDYPDLKASEQFLNLQKNLQKMENQLQAARRIYNRDVTEYNTYIKTVPTNIVAALFGFKEEELFEIEEYKVQD